MQQLLVTVIKLVILRKRVHQFFVLQQGWQWGGAASKDGVFVPTPHGIVLPHPRPTPHDGENFLTPSLPLRALRSLAPPPKTLLFLLICPTISTNFFNETYFINKNILEITTKFSHQIKLIFRKKLNNISVFNKTITIKIKINKNKNLIV